ncbi:hypothetical protein [Priestia flexa]|uniref:hypothetical protein n=1 Tax=Priestia flexa TaxID=86664 RepID=UPI001F4D2E3B|nr:hypothetical protein [Priestia flexa]
MSNDTMTVWGFWITVLGTGLGLISFFITIYIGINTSKIKKNFMKKHLQEKYKKSKKSIVLSLHTSYELLKDEALIDDVKIQESIISLQIYNEILTVTTIKKLKKLDKKISHLSKTEDIKKQKEIRNLLFEVIKRLESELDEHTEYLKEVTK